MPAGLVKVYNRGAHRTSPNDFGYHRHTDPVHTGNNIYAARNKAHIVGITTSGTPRKVLYRNSRMIKQLKPMFEAAGQSTLYQEIANRNKNSKQGPGVNGMICFDFTAIKGGKSYPIPIPAPFKCKIVAGLTGTSASTRRNSFITGAEIGSDGKFTGETFNIFHFVPDTNKPASLTDSEYYNDNYTFRTDPTFVSRLQLKETLNGGIFEKGAILGYQANVGTSEGVHVHVEAMSLSAFDKWMVDYPSFAVWS